MQNFCRPWILQRNWQESTGVKGNIQIFEYCKYQSTYAPLQLGDSFLLGSLLHRFPISAAGSTERDVCKWTFTLGPGPNVIRSKYTRKLVENRHPNSQIICVLSCTDSQTVVRPFTLVDVSITCRKELIIEKIILESWITSAVDILLEMYLKTSDNYV